MRNFGHTPYPYYWVGLTKVEGIWQWSNKHMKSQMEFYWGHGEPGHDGNCAIVSKDFDWNLDDVPCRNQHRALCEIQNQIQKGNLYED